MTVATVRRHGPLIGVQRRLAELGRLRFGEKVSKAGSKPYPRALSKWRLTSADRDLLEAAADIYGGKVRPWRGAPDEGMFELMSDTAELDVLLPPVYSGDDGAPTYPYSQAYELWEGPTLERRCDGLQATVPAGQGLDTVACMCDPQKRACAVVTRITVMLPRLPGIGVWRMDSKGMTVATQLPGTLDILAMAAAQRRFVPATLRLEQRSKRVRAEAGKTETHRFIVPVLDVDVTPGQLAAWSAETWNVPALPPTERPALTSTEPETTAHTRPNPTWGEETPLVEDGPEQSGQDEPPVVAREAMTARTPAPAGPPPDGDAWLRRIHAAGRERGLDHDGIKRIAASIWNWASPDERSLTDLYADERGELRHAIEAIPPLEKVDAPEASVEAGGGSGPPPSADPPPEPWEQAMWRTAQAHGIDGWEAIDAIARTVFPDTDLDELTPDQWGVVGAQIAAGLHDVVPARPKTGDSDD